MFTIKKMSKPLMEKKRRARINRSLEQLKSLLEKHYSYNMRKRKLEKADILELTVQHIHNLHTMRQQGMTLLNHKGISEYKDGFKGCLNKLNEYLLRTRSSQDNQGLKIIDQHMNVLDSRTQGIQRSVSVVPRSLTMQEDSGKLNSLLSNEESIAGSSVKGNKGSLGTEYNHWNPAHNPVLTPVQLVHVDFTHSEVRHYQEHNAQSIPSTCSYEVNEFPPTTCQQLWHNCWRPW